MDRDDSRLGPCAFCGAPGIFADLRDIKGSPRPKCNTKSEEPKP